MQIKEKKWLSLTKTQVAQKGNKRAKVIATKAPLLGGTEPKSWEEHGLKWFKTRRKQSMLRKTVLKRIAA
ncbi:hypothetical protein HAX54_040569, partial [Datura stramonium]|nr:hypothetical protein [Datura stramonium]